MRATATTAGEAKNEEHGALGRRRLQLHEHGHVLRADLVGQLQAHRAIVVVDLPLLLVRQNFMCLNLLFKVK